MYILEVLMGMRVTFLAILLTSMFNGIFVFAAQQQPIKLIKEDCNVKLGSLYFADENFVETDHFCVKASNDTQGKAQCNSIGMLAVNPDNPQYIDDQSGSRTNSKGQYFCLKNIDQNKKSSLCAKAKQKHKDKYTFVWDPTVDGDGNCTCAPINSSGTKIGPMKNCAQEKFADSPQDDGNDPIKAAKCRNEKIGEWSKNDADRYVCSCSNGQVIGLESAGTCSDKKSAPAVNKSITNEPLVNCVKTNVAKFNACISSAKKTEKSCSQKKAETNDIVNGLSTVAQSVLGVVTQQGAAKAREANTSAVSQCAIASLASSGLQSLMSGFLVTCDADQEACANDCPSEENADLTKICEQYLAPDPTSTTEGKLQKEIDYLKKEQDKIKPVLRPAMEYCSVQVKKDRSILNDIMNQSSAAQKAGQQCACQNSTGAAGADGTCGPSAERCMGDSPPPDCERAPIVPCKLGDLDYTSKVCECLRAPHGAICGEEIGKKAVANGIPVNSSPGPGPSNFGAPPGTTGGGGNFDTGNMDWSGRKDAPSGDGTVAGKLGGGGEALPGGGGTGGGGGGSGGAAGAPAAGDGDPEKNSNGGALSMLKSAVGSMFGGGKNNGNGNLKSKDGLGFDPDKYSNKGLRGVAGGLGMGTRNMDLFKMIQVRHGDRDKQGGFFDPKFDPK
ncbi:MAG: hypothetical protein H7061_00840 [Bdellovibrionaceae bacterium]|nr:hypothetical protein [Bdellovibrio sp.]